MCLSGEMLRKWEYTAIQFSKLLLFISFFFAAPAVSEPEGHSPGRLGRALVPRTVPGVGSGQCTTARS